MNGLIVAITSEAEIVAIESALKCAPSPVQTHLSQALSLFSDRTAPDYRNSMKEAISSIEALCKLIVGDPAADLAKALKAITRKVAIHPALSASLEKLYAYTSDGHGIRHALKDENSVDCEDAQFMLVTCSAFINYISVKASKAGISIPS